MTLDLNYSFSIDGRVYDAHKDGTPLTLIDCWRAVYGVGACRTAWLPTIYAPNGRVVLVNAGSIAARWEHVDKARRRNRNARYYLAHPELKEAA